MNKLIIFPTDTVYGIGASIYDLDNINKIYEIKGRSFDKQLPVLCSSIEQIESFAVIDNNVLKLAKAFWPGALTLILKTKDEYFKFSGERTIGVRIPNHILALSLLEKYGPLKTTSINDSGSVPLNDYETIYEKYNNKVSYIYKNTEASIGLASTIVSLVDDVKILRLGNITLEQIKESLK